MGLTPKEDLDDCCLVCTHFKESEDRFEQDQCVEPTRQLRHSFDTPVGAWVNNWPVLQGLLCDGFVRHPDCVKQQDDET